MPPLAAMHAVGDALAKATSESVWLGIASAAQHGLWLMEGPVMAFWSLVMGRAMRAAGLPYGRLLMANGLLYAGAFTAGTLGADDAAELCQTVFIILLPSWMLLTGISLLRQQAGHPSQR